MSGRSVGDDIATGGALDALGLAAAPGDSPRRFADGARYRIEIPSVEGPDVLRTVLEEAERRAVPVRRTSQGSGVMMLTDDEIRTMARLGADHGIEVNLFLGPRGAWDTGGQSFVTSSVAGAARGRDTLGWCVHEAERACALGIRSLLVADVGALWVLGRLRAEGRLPANLVLKTSVLLAPANPAAARVLSELGGDTINVATDLSVEHIAEVRVAIPDPIDVYVEVPDDQGGFVRHYEVPELVRRAAPVYLKFGLRNAPQLYPTGAHLARVACDLARERVRRAQLCLALLADLAPELVEDAAGGRPPDLGVPEP